MKSAGRFWLLAILAALILIPGGVYVWGKIRGLRNNNPGNIRKTNPPTKWQGLLPETEQTDDAFYRFKTPEFGIRAIVRILYTYKSRGLTTVEGIIARWAPPGDNNNTAAYIAAVSKHLGVLPGAQLTYPADLYPLVEAIIQHENGAQPYPEAVIRAGIALA